MRSEWPTVAGATLVLCMLALAARSVCSGILRERATHPRPLAAGEDISHNHAISEEQRQQVISTLIADGCQQWGEGPNGAAWLICSRERYLVHWTVAPYCFQIEVRGSANWEDIEREYEPVFAVAPEARSPGGQLLESAEALGRDVKDVSDGWVMHAEVAAGRKTLFMSPKH